MFRERERESNENESKDLSPFQELLIQNFFESKGVFRNQIFKERVKFV